MKRFFIFLIVLLTSCIPNVTTSVDKPLSMETALAKAGTQIAMEDMAKATIYAQTTLTQAAISTPTLEPTHIPTETKKPKHGTRVSPHPRNMPATLQVDGKIEFNVTIGEIIRGKDAWDVIIGANQFNSSAPSGMEYMIIRTRIEYTGKDEGALQISSYDVNMISKGRVLPPSLSLICCVQNELFPSGDLTLFAGGVMDGYIIRPVYVDDPNPLLVFGLRPDGSGGIFFSLN